MDIFAHGLWTNAAYEAAAHKRNAVRSRKDTWLAVFFGIAPDLFSFGVLWAINIFSFRSWSSYQNPAATPEPVHGFPGWLTNTPHFNPDAIPHYVYMLYNFTHSLIIFALAFLVVWAIRKKPYWLMAGWGLHIGIDIFSHSDKFFPTPFLFPLSDFHVNGVSWAMPLFMIINYAAIVIIYAFLYGRKHIRKDG